MQLISIPLDLTDVVLIPHNNPELSGTIKKTYTHTHTHPGSQAERRYDGSLLRVVSFQWEVAL